MIRNIFPLLSLSLLLACQPSVPQADLILTGGPIYTVDDRQPTVAAVAVKDGRILYAGPAGDSLEALAGPATRRLDLAGRTLVPGLIEGHAHLMGLGYYARQLDLREVANYAELVDKVAEAVAETPVGTWIVGRGWHQSKWTPQPELMVTGYQTHEALSAVSPDHPVYLEHASGHAAFVNAKAMQLAGISADTQVGGDGEIIRYPDGQPTGVFTEMAASLIEQHIPESTPETDSLSLETAIRACLENGITGFHDAGAAQETLDLYARFLAQGKLPLRLYVMLTGTDSALLANWYARGPQVEPFLTIRAIKLYGDGALGSRGAWLLRPYRDRPGHTGNPITPAETILKVSREGLQHGFQVCTHAIGDRANRVVLDQYEQAYSEFPDAAADARFRIEHAQHLHPEDIPRFAALGVIPAMQAIHLSSDRPWAIDRLGEQRIEEGAYVWQDLLQSGARIVNGTDAPVEPVDPLACFYASVTRQTLDGHPPGGYEPAQRMTRAEALRSYTLDAAYGAFQEEEKGSIEPGKWADFTILSQDIMTVPDSLLLDTRVEMTVIGGDVVFDRGK